MERKNNIDLATAARIARIVRTHEELVEIVKKSINFRTEKVVEN